MYLNYPPFINYYLITFDKANLSSIIKNSFKSKISIICLQTTFKVD